MTRSFFFFQAEDGIRDIGVTGVQTCALPISAERAATVTVNTSPWLVDALPDRCRVVVRLGSSTEYAAAPHPLAEDAPLEPRGFFGATKAAGSLLLQAAAAERGVRACVLRAFQVYGPGDHPTRLVPVVLSAARTGATVPLPAALSRRDGVWADRKSTRLNSRQPNMSYAR